MDQLTRPIGPARLVRIALPFAVLAACVWLLTYMIDPGLLADLPVMMLSMPPDTLVLCAGFCGLSFWAVARYDGVAHRHFKTDVDPKAARQSGFAAIALAQTLGFGVFTGAAVRWRVLPELSILQALRLSTFVALTFVPALLFLTALCSLAFLPTGWWTLPALLGVIALPIFIVTINFAPFCAPLRHLGHIPSLRAVGAILCWATLDLLAAALAFYLLIPTADLGFTAILPVFLLALSAAMLSGSPGGVGPFEIILITFLPQIPMADLLVAILCFRALYYAIPALMAVPYLLRPLASRGTTMPQEQPPFTDTLPAEMGILAQNNGSIAVQGAGAIGLLPTAQVLTQVFDPIDLSMTAAMTYLTQAAGRENRLPLIYKCSAKSAAAARRNNWKVWRIAKDAVVDVASYDLSMPTRARLRRVLRKAARANVNIVHAASLPIAQMAQLDAVWQARHGAAQGTTMGRFCPTYLARQEVFLAYQGPKLIAFASFHRDAKSLCLDLMRHGDTLPNGTMHALVQAAIEHAKSYGLSSVSLAAVPSPPQALLRVPALRRVFDRTGLYQFKNSFAPRWASRYAAAPNLATLVIGLADMTVSVHHPCRLPTPHKPHNQDEDYEFAPITAS